jgi:hypothetical protein
MPTEPVTDWRKTAKQQQPEEAEKSSFFASD